MDVFDILTLVCGLALFLYGMDVMGDALKKSAGRKLKTILGNLTSNKFKGFLLGLGVTAIIQSSSATTVMVVGFVNSGTMMLGQAVGVIMGANVGTAVTAWLTALNGIEGGADATAWLAWFKPDAWMPILALIGICCIMFSKKSKYKDVGTILMGFAVLMIGMSTMSDAVSGLKNDEGFKSILTMFSNPILGILAGTALTAIVQSSSASVGILQALSSTGAISFGAAMPIIMGQNIGTCVTALISSFGANKNGKRAAFVHLYFNIIGVVLWMGLYYLVGWILELVGAFGLFSWMGSNFIDMWGIAAIHTVFKIFSVILMAPFTALLEKLAVLTVRGTDKKGDEYTNMLDERLLNTPSIAIERCREVASQMARLSVDPLKKAIGLLENYDPKVAQEIRDAEDKVDIYEDALGSYLVKLSACDMVEADSHEVTKLLHMIGDLERISDHSVNLVESAEEIKDKELSFSDAASAEMKVMYGAVDEIITITADAFINADFDKATLVEPLEQVVDDLKDQIKRQHVIRVQKSQCTIEHGFVLSDILTNLERVSDHCSNIAGCLIEMSLHDTLDLHSYLHQVKAGGEEYNKNYQLYAKKYSIGE
ncbi:MAG: Na/Pi cotransporter family protein [Clostridia bacterium]|nr:Na/Pi cotransporter family protein [Clostridia bacterium]MBQ9798235.1 Na/Pi cotransporter family protein [Clostridia bacterium]